MPSIICYGGTGSDTAKRARGMTHMGKTFSEQLENSDSERQAVLKTLRRCNRTVDGVDYELKIKNESDLEVRVERISKRGSDKVVLTYDGTEKLVLTVIEDDDRKFNKKMTIAVPGDRSAVNDPEALYTEGVVEDINTIWDDGANDKVDAAAQYALATITFRRCL